MKNTFKNGQLKPFVIVRAVFFKISGNKRINEFDVKFLGNEMKHATNSGIIVFVGEN